MTRLENADFDIVILDIQGVAAPGLSGPGDGLDILRRVKNVNPGQVVVAFSGKKYDLSRTEFWKLADDTLVIPA